jgi:ribosomal protein S6
MKTTKTSSNRHETRRQNTLGQIAHIGPFVEGALCSVKRRGCREPGWQLTYKVKGKTKTVYVPIDMAQEVVGWTREYKRLKQLTRKVTRHSLAIIRRHVVSRRAASRARASTRA